MLSYPEPWRSADGAQNLSDDHMRPGVASDDAVVGLQGGKRLVWGEPGYAAQLVRMPARPFTSSATGSTVIFPPTNRRFFCPQDSAQLRITRFIVSGFSRP